jgi:hypothetical protein
MFMKKYLLCVGTACAAVLSVATPAHAAFVFVGSWTVDQGPRWTVVPPAYTGQEAAALLFGGVAGDYAISTIDNLAANIDHLAWVSTWGGACGGAFPCGTKVGEAFKVSANGLYQSPGDTSAYVNDWAIGAQYTNYAFLIGGAVPEPATWGMMIGGLALVGASMRRRKVAVSFA